MVNQPIPIDDDEILYRRIPVSMNWYVGGVLSGEAFEPRPDEHSGISVFRKRFRTIQEVALGKSKLGYYVVSLHATDLSKAGIQVVSQPVIPEGWDDAHAELLGLNANNRHTDAAEALQSRLAEIGLRLPVEGPFVAKADS